MYKMLLNQNQHIFGPVVQIGTVVEGTADFYSSRIPKRQRKTKMIDELLADAEFRRYVQLLNYCNINGVGQCYKGFQAKKELILLL